MELTFNELSFSNTEYPAQASILYDTFFGCCLDLEKSFKEKVNLFFSTSPQNHMFNLDLGFQAWLKGRSKEEISSILSMLTKNPIILDYPYYKISDLEGMGLGYAYENNLLLISFSSSDAWTKLYLEAKKVWINEDDALEEEDISIPNLSDGESAVSHKELISQKLDAIKLISSKGIRSGEEIWIKQAVIFPNLNLCDNLKQSLIDFPGGKRLNNLLHRLLELDQYFATWKDGDFDIHAISGDVRLESGTRFTKHKKDMTFMCPDGESRTFPIHCDFGIWGFRLHFFPDVKTRKSFIGYIGKKIGA